MKRLIGTFALLISALPLHAMEVDGKTVLKCAVPWTAHTNYDRWFDEYTKVHSDVDLSSTEFTSSAGIQVMTEAPIDMMGAASFPMTDEQIKVFIEERGSKVLHIPTMVCGVVPVYHIPGVAGEIKFTTKALVGIFLGTITKWDDPEIQNANADLKLPGNDIVVVHVATPDDNTHIWTEYLSQVSETWKEKVGMGDTVEWPVGVESRRAGGTWSLIQETPNSIGYVDLPTAVKNKMDCGSVQNAAGKFIKADVESLTAAATSSAKDLPEDFRTSVVNATGDKSYPIANLSYLLVPSEIKDKGDRKAIAGFLGWMLTDGQKSLEPQFAPLPQSFIEKETKTVEKIAG